MEDAPTYWEYKAQVDTLLSRNELTVEQAIVLLRCYNATLDQTPVHVNYLMSITSLNWQKINYLLNGLVIRGAIKRIEEKYYMV
tara:strand:- start:2285 stop:2536 length:252 start_codon:yes stop_codon:yes gene_type:complete